MILVDTNILINYLNGTDSILENIISKNEVATCGIILAELLHGVNSIKDKKLIFEALNEFNWIDTKEAIWESTGNNPNILRKKELNVPFQMLLLQRSALKIKLHLLLMTNILKKSLLT